MTAARRIGRYEVVRELGRGGMGVVFEVRDPTTDARLALKLITLEADAEALARFGREAELMARVSHPSVVRVRTLERVREGPIILAELVDGQPLSRLVRGSPLAPEAAARLVAALADGVEALHRSGVLHRDLKPQNVMVRPDGAPVLLDFGLARDRATRDKLTQTGALLGTPLYMAPEQAEGVSSAALGPATDVYGLGAILCEALAGRPPFDDAGGPIATVKRVMFDEPRWPSTVRPDVPPALEAVLRKAMARAPEARYASAAALRDDLQRFLRDGSTEAEGAPPPRSRAPRIAALVSAGLLLAVGALAFGVLGGEPPVAPPGSEAPPPATEAPPVTEASSTTEAPPQRPAEPAMIEGGITLPHPPTHGVVNGAFVDGDRVVTWGRDDGSLRVWSLARPASPLVEGQVPPPIADAVVHAPLGGRQGLIVRGPTEVLRLDLDTLEVVARWKIPYEPPIQDYESQRPLVAVGDEVFVPSRADVFVLEAARLLPRSKLAPSEPLPGQFVTACTRGPWLVVAGGRPAITQGETRGARDDRVGWGDGHVALWDLRQRDRPPLLWTKMTSAVISIALTPDDPPVVALGLSSGFLLTWRPDVERWAAQEPTYVAGREVGYTRPGYDSPMFAVAHGGHVYGVAYAADGHLLSTSCGSRDVPGMNEVRRWSPEGENVGWLVGTRRLPRSLHLSPDGERVVVGTWNATFETCPRPCRRQHGWAGAEVWDVRALLAALERR